MSASEEWREIPGWPGYMASSLGRIRSHKRDALGALMVRCLNQQTRYLQVCLHRDGKSASKTVHALVCLAFHGPRPEGMVVRHLDGTRTNNIPENLAWGTPAENSQDMVRHGTASRHMAERTHCPAGHQYDTDNTYRRPAGSRRCRRCDREQVAARRQRPEVPIIRAWARANGLAVSAQGRIPPHIQAAYEAAHAAKRAA